MLEADIDLMVQNAVTFNGTESLVGQAAITLQDKFHQMLNSNKAQPRKRKEKDGDTLMGNGGPNKKAKLS